VELLIALLNLAFIFSVLWWIWKSEISSIRKFYWPAVLLKLLAGILVGVIYSSYYTDSDTFFFFNEAVTGASKINNGVNEYFNFLFSSSDDYYSGEDRMNFFIKITSLFCLLTGNNYWITSLYFSFVSFLSAWWLVKLISNYFPNNTISALVAFLFFPSCIFWSSGILKESIALAALFYLTGIFLQVWVINRINLFQIVAVIISVWVGWNLKYYYFGLLIPILLSAWVGRFLSSKRKLSTAGEFVLLLFIFFVCLIGASFMHPNFSLNKILNVVVSNNQMFVTLSSYHDVIHFYNLKATWLSLITNAPWALFSGLFRPCIWEAENIMQVLASLENLCLLVFALISVGSIPPILKSENRLLIFGTLMYCVLLCVFLALSAPNFGTLARYRVGFLPFFVLLIANHPFINKHLSKVL